MDPKVIRANPVDKAKDLAEVVAFYREFIGFHNLHIREAIKFLFEKFK